MTLLLGDCLEQLKSIPDNSVDSVASHDADC
jgi:DNA modification methylase